MSFTQPGCHVMVPIENTHDVASIVGYYPVSRRARRRAENTAQTIRSAGIPAYVKEGVL